jgi:hypothetical protein
MPEGRTWLPDQLTRLEQMWKEGLSYGEMAKKLGDDFTRNACIGKANRMGLKRFDGGTSRVLNAQKRTHKRVWTKDKDAILISLYPTEPVDILAAMCGVSIKSVRIRANIIGVTRPKRVHLATYVKKRPDTKPTAEYLTDIRARPSDPPEAERVAFNDLKIGRCKWPLDGKSCGRKACQWGHGSYCEGHYARSVTSNRRVA